MESRSELSHGFSFALPGDDHTARFKPALAISANHSPPKTPLYLRIERLLF